jgi:hypothetical protein
MQAGMMRTLVALAGLLPLLFLNGCPNPNGDCGDFGCGDDDDDTSGEFECPNVWYGFGSTIEDWAVIAVSGRGGADFQIGQRNFTQYEILPFEWEEQYNLYSVDDRPGGCFQDFGGMFLGDGDAYDESLFSVAFSLESEGDWPGGSIQVIPINGDDPYPIGDPNSVRGTAIEPDGEGGFVVCGSLEADVDNSVIWVDFDGTILAKDDMPTGSCYDLFRSGDGTYIVTDTTEGVVYRYDLDFGEFTEIGALPPDGDFGTGDWVVGEGPDGMLYLGDDVEVFSMDPALGSAEHYTFYTPGDHTGSHTLRLNWSTQLDTLSSAMTYKDLPSSNQYGPHSGGVFRVSDGDNPSVVAAHDLQQGELVVDYEFIDLQEYIDYWTR